MKRDFHPLSARWLPIRNRKTTALNSDKHTLHEDQIAAALIERGDRARDERNYRDAASLYREAVRIQPGNAAIHIQCGHACKEVGDLGGADYHYREAQKITPDDPDLALQLGHFYKVAGRLPEADAAYRRALELDPGWAVPVAELAGLNQAGWMGAARPRILGTEEDLPADSVDFAKEAEELLPLHTDGLVPELAPRKPSDIYHKHLDAILIHRFGRSERSRWGMMPTLRGVEAIRGYYNSSDPLLQIWVILNGLVVHRGALSGGFVLRYERENEAIRKYVFNVWHDFSRYNRGCYDVELRFIKADGGTLSHHEKMVIAQPLEEANYPDSNAVITLPPDDIRPAAEQINARPSVLRSPKPDLFAQPIRNVLVARTDQLGDMVTSIPALRRLREILPKSRLVGLLTSANAEFAQTLGIFDEIIVAEFPDDRWERRRIMSLETQRALRDKLATYNFDVALDLAEASVSRPILLLSGAPFMYGFYDREWPWLTAGFEGASHDPRTGRETVPHSTRVLGFVERFGAMLKSRAEILRRPELSPALLTKFGLSQTDRFAVLHTGARIGLARWSGYDELATLLLDRTDMKVVMLTDEPTTRIMTSPRLLDSARFSLIDQRPSFDEFDALVSFCTAFVGNDSGPKHLAALRGANVVSVQSSRVGWNEWGQEIGGLILSRKVPCAGCQLIQDPEECGQNYVCVAGITAEEVFDAVMQLLKPAV